LHRILFHIGPFTLYTYGLFVAVAFVLGSLLILRDSKKAGISETAMLDCLLAILIGGIIGGRLLFVLINMGDYISDPARILMLHEGGLAFHGSLAGGLAAGAICAKLRGIPLLKGVDVVAPYIALGQAIGRVGCFMNGCCFGKVIDHGIGVTFPGEDVMRVPVQLYSSAALLVIFALLIAIRRGTRTRGAVFAWYLILYGIYRTMIEFLRGDNPAVFMGLDLAQLISVGMFAAGVVMWGILKARGERRD